MLTIAMIQRGILNEPTSPMDPPHADQRPSAPAFPPAMSLRDLQPSFAAVRAFSIVPRTVCSSRMKSSSLGSICERTWRPPSVRYSQPHTPPATAPISVASNTRDRSSTSPLPVLTRCEHTFHDRLAGSSFKLNATDERMRASSCGRGPARAGLPAVLDLVFLHLAVEGRTIQA